VTTRSGTDLRRDVAMLIQVGEVARPCCRFPGVGDLAVTGGLADACDVPCILVERIQ
jgi:hypothetical protein